MTPNTPTSQERLRHAKICGRASGIEGLVNADRAKLDELRTAWPELAERIDRICELVDWG